MFFFYFNRSTRFPAGDIDPQAVIQRLMPFNPSDRSGFLAPDSRSLLVQCVTWNTSRSRLEPAPLHHGPSGLVAASWARLDNRDELGEKLGLAPPVLAGLCDTELILQAYLTWGENCVDHLIGDFVFVVYDRKRGAVFCGRDHMGVRPLYYYAFDDLFVCATSLPPILGLMGVPVRVEQKWIAEYLLHLSMSFDSTPYEGIKKLPPAHCLRATPKGIQLRRYFTLSAEPELKLKASRDYVDAYREQLETAIKCRLDSEYAIGCELSGGVDSSTIAAYAATFLHPLSRLHTFSFSHLEQELQHIRAVTDAFGLQNNHVIAEWEAESRQATERSLAILGYPVEHGNATFHEPFYRVAEKLEIRTLLSGFGGDEFGTTIHGYLVPMQMIVERRFWELFDILPGNALFRLLRILKLEAKRIKTQNFKTAVNLGFHEAYKKRWPNRIVREELVRRYDLEQRYFDVARFDSGYTDLKRFTLEKRWEPFVPTRMENCTLMAAARKIEYGWPLLDVRLVRLFLSIPSEENFYRGMGRYLHRRAIDGVVPKLVAWKQSKYMGEPIDGGRHGAGCHLSADDLHPALAEYVDVKKMKHQVGLLSSPAAGTEDTRGLLINRNIRAATAVSDWMKYLDGLRK